MSASAYRMWLKANREFKALTRRPFARFISPFVGAERPLIIHCCYHKVGTVWFGRVLREVAAEFGLSIGVGSDYEAIAHYETRQDSAIFLDLGSHVKLDQLRRYKGSHMIRDPRDLVVSGYFYHKWTDEHWANLPRAEYRGMSYRQYLNSVSKEQGLLAEIRQTQFWINHMADWNYNDSAIYEIRYEDILEQEEGIFRELFAHYEFSPDAVDRCCSIARKYSFKTLRAKGGTGEGSHLRSGRPQEWREHFSERHVALFKEMYPGIVARLGYEEGDDW